MKASVKGRYEVSKNSASTTVAINAGNVKFKASMTDATFIDGPSLNGLALGIEKPGAFIIDYNVPKKNARFQFMNSIKILEKPLNWTYIHGTEDKTTILNGTLVFDSANKLSANHVVGTRNCKLKYTYLHGGMLTFEPSYDIAKNSWDFAVSQKIYGDDAVRASYQTSSKLLGLEWTRDSKINGSFTVRRYVYHDVIRLDDLEKLIDCGFVQPYTTNSAKVVFLNQRPQSRPFKGSGSICNTCERSLQEPYHFCSLACKVQYLVRYEGCISRYLYDCEYLPLSDFVCAQYEGCLEDGQMTPSSVLDGGISFHTSSGSSASGAVGCKTLGCTATTEFVRRKKRSSNNYRNVIQTVTCLSPSPAPSANKRKGVPHRSPFY